MIYVVPGVSVVRLVKGVESPTFPLNMVLPAVVIVTACAPSSVWANVMSPAVVLLNSAAEVFTKTGEL